MPRMTGTGGGRRAVERVAETHRIQRELAQVVVEAQRCMQEAMPRREGVWLEPLRRAVLRLEAAMADVVAAAAGLTRREVEVYRLEREGYGAEGIGERLMIQPGTVRTHLKRLHGKLVAAGLRVPHVRSSRDSHDDRTGRSGDEEAEGRYRRRGVAISVASREKYPNRETQTQACPVYAPVERQAGPGGLGCRGGPDRGEGEGLGWAG